MTYLHADNLMTDTLAPELEIYRENVIDHYKNPRNVGRLDPCSFSHRDLNPSCGDRIELFVRFGADGRVAAATFEGRGCAVSQAAMSMLTDHVVGKTADELDTMEGDSVLALLGIPVGPTRMKCAMLGLKTLKGGLAGYKTEQRI